MRKLVICTAIASCFIGNAFAQAPTHTYTSIHTLGKPAIVKAKGTGILDLSELLKSNSRLVFAVKDPKSGRISYTRDAVFYGKNDGYYYQGKDRLQGYPISTDITSPDCKLTDVKAPAEELPAIATTAINYGGNLNAGDSVPSITPFDPNNAYTFNYTTAATIYDSLGDRHNLQVYYVKHAVNDWNTFIYVDGSAIGSGELTYSTSGILLTQAGMNALSFIPTNGAAPQVVSLNYSGFTQFATPDYSTPPEIDGMPVGIYAAYQIDMNGYISFNYNNGQSITFSKVAVFLM